MYPLLHLQMALVVPSAVHEAFGSHGLGEHGSKKRVFGR